MPSWEPSESITLTSLSRICSLICSSLLLIVQHLHQGISSSAREPLIKSFVQCFPRRKKADGNPSARSSMCQSGRQPPFPAGPASVFGILTLCRHSPTGGGKRQCFAGRFLTLFSQEIILHAVGFVKGELRQAWENQRLCGEASKVFIPASRHSWQPFFCLPDIVNTSHLEGSGGSRQQLYPPLSGQHVKVIVLQQNFLPHAPDFHPLGIGLSPNHHLVPFQPAA